MIDDVLASKKQYIALKYSDGYRSEKPAKILDTMDDHHPKKEWSGFALWLPIVDKLTVTRARHNHTNQADLSQRHNSKEP